MPEVVTLAAHRLVVADLDLALTLGGRRHSRDFLVPAREGDFDILGTRQGDTRREQRREGGALESRSHRVSPLLLTV